jgi:carboxymethylenebutenolidase
MAEHDLVALGKNTRARSSRHRDVDAVTATLVDEPYVNHIPTMTGGVGSRSPG